MAILLLRTDVLLIVVLVITNLTVQVKSENEGKLQSKSDFMTNIPAQHLLRGSSEEVSDLLTKQIEEPITHIQLNNEGKVEAIDNATERRTTTDNNNYRTIENMISDVTQDVRASTTETAADTTLADVFSQTLKEDEIFNTYIHTVEQKLKDRVEVDERFQITKDENTSAQPTEDSSQLSTLAVADINTVTSTDGSEFRFRSGLFEEQQENNVSQNNIEAATTVKIFEKVIIIT